MPCWRFSGKLKYQLIMNGFNGISLSLMDKHSWLTLSNTLRKTIANNCTASWYLRIVEITVGNVLHTHACICIALPVLVANWVKLNSGCGCYIPALLNCVGNYWSNVDPSVVSLSLGDINLEEGGDVSSFPWWGPGTKLQSQVPDLTKFLLDPSTPKKVPSGPVAVFFKCCKEFHICLSEISGTWTPCLNINKKNNHSIQPAFACPM